MRKKFHFYMDGGHGWLKVKRSELEELMIASTVSSYSYERGDDVFLEEDCDCTLFLKAMERAGIPQGDIKITEHYSENSKIRSYQSYEYQTFELKKEITNLRTRMLQYTNWHPRVRKQINTAGIARLRYWQGHYGF